MDNGFRQWQWTQFQGFLILLRFKQLVLSILPLLLRICLALPKFGELFVLFNLDYSRLGRLRDRGLIHLGSLFGFGPLYCWKSLLVGVLSRGGSLLLYLAARGLRRGLGSLGDLWGLQLDRCQGLLLGRRNSIGWILGSMLLNFMSLDLNFGLNHRLLWLPRLFNLHLLLFVAGVLLLLHIGVQIGLDAIEGYCEHIKADVEPVLHALEGILAEYVCYFFGEYLVELLQLPLQVPLDLPHGPKPIPFCFFLHQLGQRLFLLDCAGEGTDVRLLVGQLPEGLRAVVVPAQEALSAGQLVLQRAPGGGAHEKGRLVRARRRERGWGRATLNHFIKGGLLQFQMGQGRVQLRDKYQIGKGKIDTPGLIILISIGLVNDKSYVVCSKICSYQNQLGQSYFNIPTTKYPKYITNSSSTYTNPMSFI